AWQALFEMADLKRGQTVLVHAGAGGVGTFAVQFAHSAGARVIATASDAGVEIAERLGADQVIDYRATDFVEGLSGVDLVLDTVGGETQQRSFLVLRPGGVLLSTVSPPDEALAKAHRVTAGFVFHASDASRLEKVVRHIDSAGTTVLLDRTMPLHALAEAFAYQGSGRARGKIVVAVAAANR
ncbi:MAG: NADP-dependent oxidoreductase, partial [Myxococcales bacterium]|nr:NADP-dependent oxidoreductase [Myxococcales bacterium]